MGDRPPRRRRRGRARRRPSASAAGRCSASPPARSTVGVRRIQVADGAVVHARARPRRRRGDLLRARRARRPAARRRAAEIGAGRLHRLPRGRRRTLDATAPSRSTCSPSAPATVDLSTRFPRLGLSMIGARFVESVAPEPGTPAAVHARGRSRPAGAPAPRARGPRRSSTSRRSSRSHDRAPADRAHATQPRRRGRLDRDGAPARDVPPGKAAAPAHCHSLEEEIFIVLDGEGTLALDGEQTPVRAGHVVSRPAGTGVSHVFIAGAGASRSWPTGRASAATSATTRARARRCFAGSASTCASSAWTTGTARTDRDLRPPRGFRPVMTATRRCPMRTSVAAALAALALAAPSTLAAGGDPAASTGSANVRHGDRCGHRRDRQPERERHDLPGPVRHERRLRVGDGSRLGGLGHHRDRDQRPDRRPRPRHHLPLPRRRDEPERDGRRRRATFTTSKAPPSLTPLAPGSVTPTSALAAANVNPTASRRA